MNDHNIVTPVDDDQENTSQTPAQSPQTPPLDEAAITAQVEQRLRRQLAELTEIAAQAKRLGVTVDPAQALARGVTPDALRQSVLKQAAERDVAQDIVADAPQQPHTKLNPSLTVLWSKRPKPMEVVNEHTFDFSHDPW